MTADAEIPKGYKLTEVGVIPEDWEVMRGSSLHPGRDHRGPHGDLQEWEN